jgi:hypothetical protein
MNISLHTAIRFGKIIPAGNDPDFLETQAGSKQYHLQLTVNKSNNQNFIATDEDATTLLGMSQFKTDTMCRRMVDYIKARIPDKVKDLNPFSVTSWGYTANTPYRFKQSGITPMGNEADFADHYKPSNQAVVTFRENNGKHYNFVAKGWDAVALAGLCENFNKVPAIEQLVFDYVKERASGNTLDDFNRGSVQRIKYSLGDPIIEIDGKEITIRL